MDRRETCRFSRGISTGGLFPRTLSSSSPAMFSSTSWVGSDEVLALPLGGILRNIEEVSECARRETGEQGKKVKSEK
jgi:hypothetical protein